MIYHRFSQKIEQRLRRVGFARRHEVEVSPEFHEFMANNPLPLGHCYVFTFENGSEFGASNVGDMPPNAVETCPNCH